MQLEIPFTDALPAAQPAINQLPAADKPQYIANTLSPGQLLSSRFSREVLLRKVCKCFYYSPGFLEDRVNRLESLPTDR